MRPKFIVATAAAAAFLATSLVSGSAQATPLPVLKSDIGQGVVTLVGKGGGRGGGHGGGRGGGHGHAGGYKGGGKSFAYKGGGKHYGYKGGGKHYGYKGGGKHYAYKGNYNRYKNYGYSNRRYYGWYGLPYLAYGYGGGCAWLYRNAIATNDPYWWNRYYACTGYY
ncbi:MAG: hypothetical protein AB7V40_11900 [Methyloceanibacter sp.]